MAGGRPVCPSASSDRVRPDWRRGWSSSPGAGLSFPPVMGQSGLWYRRLGWQASPVLPGFGPVSFRLTAVGQPVYGFPEHFVVAVLLQAFLPDNPGLLFGTVHPECLSIMGGNFRVREGGPSA